MRPTSVRGQGRTLRMRGSCYWWIAFYDGHGREHRQTTKIFINDSNDRAEKAALAFLKDKIKEVNAAEKGGPQLVTAKERKVTINELLDSLERSLRLDRKFTAKTASNLKPLRAHFGDMRAMAVSTDCVERYIEKLLAEGYSRATVNRRTQLLNQSYNVAIKHRLLNQHAKPCIRHLSEGGNARKGFVNREQLDRVIAGLPSDLTDFVLFGFLSSWRKGEIASLTWDNVTPDTIRLAAESSKEREARSLPRVGEIDLIIERRRALANGPLVFHRNGKPVGDLRKSWATALKLAGIPGLIFHDLRRSGVRDLIRAGVAPHVAMSISGHKTDSMLRRYVIISEADQRAALQRTEEFRKTEIVAAIPSPTVQ